MLAEKAAIQHTVDAIESVLWAHRRAVITAKGRIGNVHPQARKGDVICVVPGCSMPVALCRKDTIKYEVIGDVWIYRFVGGDPGFECYMTLIKEGRPASARTVHEFRRV